MKKTEIKPTISKILLVLVVIIYAIPLYIAVVNSVKTFDEIILNPLALPTSLEFSNFTEIWVTADMPRLYWNSIVITGCSLAVLVFITSMSAFVLARKKGKRYILVHSFFLLGLMIPVQMILIPSIKTLQIYGLFHTLPGMILFNCAVYFSTAFFLYYEFFKTLPLELEESAKIDGASRFAIYRQILFPLLKPCTSTVMIFSGMWIWNDFLPPMYLLDAERGSTITTGIYRSIGQYVTNWNLVFSAVILASLPIIIIYLFMQKQFTSGMVAGAVKG